MKVASMVTGILSILFCFFPIVGIILGIIGIATAYVTRPITGMAAAGLTCGIIGLCLSVLFTSCISCAACGAFNM